MRTRSRKLIDLVSVGPATVEALKSLGIQTIPVLARCSASDLYQRLSLLRGARQDPCVQDVFSAAIAQAKNPKLPKHKANWWYWSNIRKGVSDMSK
jgi:hypothetical protein